ncbi:hypothetical protein A2U01_0059799, partial [Trifolium medium]|nr:hypothetical protein [Trifolium medium]
MVSEQAQTGQDLPDDIKDLLINRELNPVVLYTWWIVIPGRA